MKDVGKVVEIVDENSECAATYSREGSPLAPGGSECVLEARTHMQESVVGVGCTVESSLAADGTRTESLARPSEVASSRGLVNELRRDSLELPACLVQGVDKSAVIIDLSWK